MLTLIMLFAMQVTTPGEMSCGASILDFSMPSDIYIAGSAEEGPTKNIAQGQILYLSGPRVPFLKVGDINRVVRRMNNVRDPRTGKVMGVQYKDLGTIHVEAVNKDNALARVVLSCEAFVKGDMVFPYTPKPMINFSGQLSRKDTIIPDSGTVGPILLGLNNKQLLATGQLCFFGLGWRDGVKPGDHFTVFRPPTSANYKEASLKGESSSLMPSKRKLPSKILGDIVIVDVGDKSSTGKIINSLSEIYPGDLAIKR
jgi:hypothetical protein